MSKSWIRIGCSGLVSGILVAATATPSFAAGTQVQVMFSGSGFTGCFEYDQSQAKDSPHKFSFTGSVTHQLCYKLGSAEPVCTSGSTCEPYVITTSGNSDTTFQLQATIMGSTTATIVFNTGVTFLATSLPTCTQDGKQVFPNTGTFTLTGATTFCGTITSTSCTQPAVGTNCPCGSLAVSPPSAPAPVAPAPPPVCCIYVCPAPPIVPVYACRPQPTGCLARLFSRCFSRTRCQ